MKTLRFPISRWARVAALAGLSVLAAGPALGDADVLFAGGGVIADGSGAEARRISFSVSLFMDGDGASAGRLQFRFHDLDDAYGLDRSQFTALEFGEVLIETRYLPTTEEPTPYDFVRIVADGRLDGVDGWSVLARFADFGTPVSNKELPPEHADALRLMLFNPGGTAVYDTAFDFPRDQSWRTLLDGGNVAVDIRLETDR